MYALYLCCAALSLHSACSESLRGACEAPRRSSGGGRKIGAACNAFAEKAIERSAEARSAESLRKGEAQRAEPTWHRFHSEAGRAEDRGPKARGEILGVVNLWGYGSELDSGSPQVIIP